MPELPEVDTIVRELQCGREGIFPVTGRQVQGAHLFWKKTLANSSAEDLNKKLKGEVVRQVCRRGKFINIQFGHCSLLIHLRMSGDLRVEEAGGLAPQKHDRLVIDFTDGWRLAFNDPRKFGRAWLAADPGKILAHLGPEPLDPALTPARFHRMLASRSRQLKPLLLDQAFLAGLGNIYTDEALHMARLHPLRSSASLDLRESQALLKAIRAVLRKGIQSNGASIDWVYRGGQFQNQFRVYQRQGSPCPVCGTPVTRILVGQRGTHFCPSCQRLDK
jgi:formamidopyrimidine-DNA glycosylase